MQYRNIDFTKAYVKSIGYSIVKGVDVDTIAPMTPFLLMDCALDYYRKYLAPVELHHESLKYRKMWKAAYDRFNQRCFRAFTPDMRDAFIEKMDDFHEFMEKDLYIGLTQCENIFRQDYSGEDLELLAASLMMNELTCKACTLYSGICYDSRLGSPEHHAIHPDFRDMLNSLKFLSSYRMDGNVIIPERVYKQFVAASEIISKKTIQWVGKNDELSRECMDLLEGKTGITKQEYDRTNNHTNSFHCTHRFHDLHDQGDKHPLI